MVRNPKKCEHNLSRRNASTICANRLQTCSKPNSRISQLPMAEAYQEASGAEAQQAQAAQVVVSKREVVMWLHERARRCCPKPAHQALPGEVPFL